MRALDWALLGLIVWCTLASAAAAYYAGIASANCQTLARELARRIGQEER